MKYIFILTFSLMCGVKPIAPVMCKNHKFICQCTDMFDCEWVIICEE